MLTSKQVCDRLTSIYPDFGECGKTLDVNWNVENQAWEVDFEYNGSKLRHYLENKDAAACILTNRCMEMGIEFGQLR